MKSTISTDQKIINALLLNASFIDNIGLMHGKMGISIFFFHLARQTKNQIYEDYAGELIDEIYEEITLDTPVDFENGLAGIGWGIEYLVQNKFIEADTDEILEEFDDRVFKELIYNTPKEIGLLNGILGIGAYFLKRLQSASRLGMNLATNDEKNITLTNKQALFHLIDEIERLTQDLSITILEPVAIFQTIEPSNNQVFEHLKPETKEIIRSKPCFDITWNYPVLLWFLAELYQRNIFSFKVEKIIQRLIEPLSSETNLPTLQSNRLLLTLALTKLQKTLECSNSQTHELLNAGTITTSLFMNLNKETLKSELFPKNLTVKHGTSGITWIYKQLFELTNDRMFNQELEFWIELSLNTEKVDNGFVGFNFENEDNAFGFMEGLAGIRFVNFTNLT